MNIAFIRSTFEKFQAFEYCDDRYVLLLRYAIAFADIDLVREIVAVLRTNSTLPAFLVTTAAMIFDRVPPQETSALLSAALNHVDRLGAYKSFAPIDYTNPRTQPTLEQFRQHCLQRLDADAPTHH